MNNNVNPFQSIEKHLLCVMDCGCYITTQDIVRIGEALHMALPFKKRAFILQNLFLEAKQTQKHETLVQALHHLLATKHDSLLQLVTLYPQTQAIMTLQLHKIKATQMLLTQEYTLHIKEISHEF